MRQTVSLSLAATYRELRFFSTSNQWINAISQRRATALKCSTHQCNFDRVIFPKWPCWWSTHQRVYYTQNPKPYHSLGRPLWFWVLTDHQRQSTPPRGNEIKMLRWIRAIKRNDHVWNKDICDQWSCTHCGEIFRCILTGTSNSVGNYKADQNIDGLMQ